MFSAAPPVRVGNTCRIIGGRRHKCRAKGNGFLPNAHEAIECELAALEAGFPWVTLTARLTWAEVRGVIVASAPRVLVTTREGAATIAATAGGWLARFRARNAGRWQIRNWEGWLGRTVMRLAGIGIVVLGLVVIARA